MRLEKKAQVCQLQPVSKRQFLAKFVRIFICINRDLIHTLKVKLQSLEDEGQFRNGWLICTRGKSFAVYAATATEKQEWMAHIEKCIRDLLTKSGKKAANEHAAVWVPDAEANTCMVCKKIEFTFLNRRVREKVALLSIVKPKLECICRFSITVESAARWCAAPAPVRSTSSPRRRPSRSGSARSATTNSPRRHSSRSICKVI